MTKREKTPVQKDLAKMVRRARRKCRVVHPNCRCSAEIARVAWMMGHLDGQRVGEAVGEERARKAMS